MDSEKLLEACQMAGMDVLSSGDNWLIHVRPGFNLHPDFDDEREWIESRCADLLVRKVLDMDRQIWPIGGSCASSEERITAAMDVLGGADND